MSDILSTVVNIVEVLAYWVVFVAAAVTAYLTLRQAKVKAWLEGANTLVRVVIFILLTYALYTAVNWVIPEIFELPWKLIYRNNLGELWLSGFRCLGGALGLATLSVGAYLSVRRSTADK